MEKTHQLNATFLINSYSSVVKFQYFNCGVAKYILKGTLFVFLEQLLRPCRVHLGLKGNSKFNDGKKYHKQVQTSKTSCGQHGSPDQLQGSKLHHRCIICNCAFTSLGSMVQHMHREHAGLFIVCKHNGKCSKIFLTEREKSEHILQLTNKESKLINCDFCCALYFKHDSARHLKKHHKNDNVVRCSYHNCSTHFRSEEEKQNHEALVHASTKKLNCIFCNLFFTASSIVRHYQTFHKSLFANAFKCKFHCRRYFLTEADREEHIASAHKIIAVVRAEATCLYCNKICIDKRELDRHIRRVHSAVKILCKFFTCGQYFHTQIEADEHFEKQHQKMEENKKYRCLKCNFKSAYQGNLKIHIYKMHKEKILPCPKCSRCFSSSITRKKRWVIFTLAVR
jgi:hypothetical protein